MTLLSGGSISGRLFADENGDNTEFDGAGGFDRGLEGQRVELYKIVHGQYYYVGHTTTDHIGNYSFSGLSAHTTYVVKFPTSVNGDGLIQKDVGPVGEDSDAYVNTGLSDPITIDKNLLTLQYSNVQNIDAGYDASTSIPSFDGAVDGEEFGEVMSLGYNDANGPTDQGGDIITNGADTIFGNGGDDTIFGEGGADLIYGDDGGNAVSQPADTTDTSTAINYQVISLGSFGTEIDPIEANGTSGFSENGGALNDEIFGSTGDPLSANVVQMIAGFGNGDGQYDGDNTVSSETFFIDGVQYTFDGSAVYNGTVVTFEDGSTAVVSAVVFQDTVGNLYLAPEFSNNADTTIYTSQPITSIQLGTQDTSGSFGNGLTLERVVDSWVETSGTENGAVGDDSIDGGDGNDTIFGEGGNDTIDGGTGADLIYGDSSGDLLGVPTAPTTGTVAAEGGVATLLVWDAGQISYSGGNPFVDGTSGLHDPSGITMTLGSDQTPVAVGVNDGSTSHFNDGDTSQDIVNSETIDGVFASAGSNIVPEYQYTVQNVDTGEIINVYAVEFNSNQVVGFVTDAPMEQGATYTFVDNVSTHPSVAYGDLATTYIIPGTDGTGGGAGNGGDVAPGDDLLYGDAGNDTIFGDNGGPEGGTFTGPRESFNWDQLNSTEADTTVTQDTGDVIVTYTRTQDTGSHDSDVDNHTVLNTSGIDSGNEAIDTDSSLTSVTNGDGNTGAFQWEFSEPVGNVEFNVNDLDGDGEVTIRAFDADGNEIPVTLIGGADVTIDGNTATGGLPYQEATDDGNNVQVEIAGPVARIELVHTQNGPDNSGINITDIYYDSGFEPNTDDGIGGDDTIVGGEGADVMFGEGGDDTFVVSSASEGAGDVIDGGNGPDETTDNDVLDLTGAGPVTIDDAADANDAGATAGTVTFADGSTLTFEGIEQIITDPQDPGDAVITGRVFLDEDFDGTENGASGLEVGLNS